MPPASTDRRAATVARSRLGRLLPAALVEEPAPALDVLARGLPESVAGARFRLDPRSVAVLGALCVAAVALAGWFVVRGSPVELHEPPVLMASGRPVGSSAAAPSGSGAVQSAPVLLVVDVAGRVRRPGLVRLPTGSRVADALAAAGGALPGVDLTAVNLAQALQDGQQVVVGVAGSAGSGGVPGVAGAAGAGPADRLDLNTATLDQLDALPGVGPVLAQRIVDWRLSHGRFSRVDELAEVGGLGEKKLAEIRPKVRV